MPVDVGILKCAPPSMTEEALGWPVPLTFRQPHPAASLQAWHWGWTLKAQLGLLIVAAAGSTRTGRDAALSCCIC